MRKKFEATTGDYLTWAIAGATSLVTGAGAFLFGGALGAAAGAAPVLREEMLRNHENMERARREHERRRKEFEANFEASRAEADAAFEQRRKEHEESMDRMKARHEDLRRRADEVIRAAREGGNPITDFTHIVDGEVVVEYHEKKE